MGTRGVPLLGIPPVLDPPEQQVVTQVVVERSGFERVCGVRALAASIRAVEEETK